MAPLTDAVGFVDGEKRDFDVLEQVFDFCKGFFRREIEQFEGSCHTFTSDDSVGSQVVAAVKCLCLNTVCTQCFYLVFHQADQR